MTKTQVTSREIQSLNDRFKLMDQVMNSSTATSVMENIGYIKIDPSLFAYLFFKNPMDNTKPMKVFPHQDVILNDTSKRVAVNCSRQIGKTTLAAVKAPWFAYNNPGTDTVVVSATLDQSKEVIKRIKDLLYNSRFSDWYKKSSFESTSQIIIKRGTAAPSRIKSIPAADSGRGYSPKYVICDEAAFWENGDYIFKEVVEPFSLQTDAKIDVFSSPNGKKGFFWEIFNPKSGMKEYWNTYSFAWNVCPTLTSDRMKRLFAGKTKQQIAATYEAKFISPISSYFDDKEIDDAVSKEAGLGAGAFKDLPMAVGVDFGKIKDRSVVMIGVIENPEDPENMQRINIVERRVKPLGTNYTVILEELKIINETLSPDIFCIDATGGIGEAPCDILKAAGLPVDPVKFSIQSKMKYYGNLKVLFQEQRVKIPREVELTNQLKLFEYQLTDSANIKLHAPKGEDFHDDECDSLVLAVWGLTRYGGYHSAAFVPHEYAPAQPKNKGQLTKCQNKDCDEYYWNGRHESCPYCSK